MNELSTGMGIQNYTPKSFWKKPEGTMGYALAAAGVGAGLVGAYFALPFLLTIVMGTLQLVVALTVLGGIIYVATCTALPTLAKNVFQSICRGLASIYTTVDPIGILRNNLDDMKHEKADLDQTVQRFAGSEERLKRKIAEKQDLIQQSLANSQQCTVVLARKTDPLERERISLKQQTELQKAGLLDMGLKQLTALEGETSNMLTTFRHWSQVADSKIQRTEYQVEFLAEQRSTILDAKSTLSKGQQLLRGNPAQLQLVDNAIEYLAEDASRTIGEIREFSRYSDKMLTDIDIENGAQAEAAKEHFSTLNQKLLSSSAAVPVDVLAGIMPSAASRSASVTVQSQEDYGQLLDKVVTSGSIRQ